MARVSKEAWRKSSLRTKEINVEQLGGTVLIRELPSNVSATFSDLLEVVAVGNEQRAKVNVEVMERKKFAFGVVNDDLSPMFTEAEAGELQAIHGAAIKHIIDEIDQLSGIDSEAARETELRFPSGGTGENGATVDDAASAGSGGPDLPTRASRDVGQERAGANNG